MAESSYKKILIAVISSVITAAVLWFAGLLPALWRGSLTAFKAIWLWLTSLHSFTLHGGTLLVVGVCLATGLFVLSSSIWRLTPWFRNSSSRYTTDIFFAARWTWSYFLGGVSGLWCECPHCSTTLVYSDYYDQNGNARTHFSCETCNHRSDTFEGHRDYALSKVTRQIERKIKTGEYKKHIKG